MNRLIPIFLRGETILKQKEQKLIKIGEPFLDEISSLDIIKLLDKSTQSTIMLKVKFLQNMEMLDMTNSSSKTLILSPKSTGNFRPEVFRLLQNLTGSVTAEFKQIL